MKEKDWDKDDMFFEEEFSNDIHFNKNFIYKKSNYLYKSTSDLNNVENVFSNYESNKYNVSDKINSEVYLSYDQLIRLQNEEWTKNYPKFVVENKTNQKKYFYFRFKVVFWKFAFSFILISFIFLLISFFLKLKQYSIFFYCI